MQPPERVRTGSRAASADAARLIIGWNGPHGDQFREMAAHAVDTARERFRADVESPLPPPGADPVFDALVECERQLDASPEGVRDAARRLLELASADAAEPGEGRVPQDRPPEDLALGQVPSIVVVGGMRALAPEPDAAAPDGAGALDEQATGVARVARDDDVSSARGKRQGE